MSEHYCINCNSLLGYNYYINIFQCVNTSCGNIYFADKYCYYIYNLSHNQTLFDIIQKNSLLILNKENNCKYHFDVKVPYNKAEILNVLDNLIFA